MIEGDIKYQSLSILALVNIQVINEINPSPAITTGGSKTLGAVCDDVLYCNSAKTCSRRDAKRKLKKVKSPKELSTVSINTL